MKVVQGANLAVRFLVLEGGALAVAAYWGYTTGDGVLRWALAIGAPLLVAAAWGLFVSPKAKVDVPRPCALRDRAHDPRSRRRGARRTGHEALAVAFAALAVLSGALNYSLSD